MSMSSFDSPVNLALCESTFLSDQEPEGVLHLSARQAGTLGAEANVEEQRTFVCTDQIGNAGVTSEAGTGLLVHQNSNVIMIQCGKRERLGVVDALPVGLFGPIPVRLERPVSP